MIFASIPHEGIHWTGDNRHCFTSQIPDLQMPMDGCMPHYIFTEKNFNISIPIENIGLQGCQTPNILA